MNGSRATALRQPVSEAGVITKAVQRAATALGVSHRVLAKIIGLSEASVSRMGSGTYHLVPGDKPFELAVLFIRLYRALDTQVDGDAAAARAWLNGHNLALGDTPIVLIQTLSGLVNTVAYLDARRALL